MSYGIVVDIDLLGGMENPVYTFATPTIISKDSKSCFNR